jgi:aspartyl/glutamyl-tRNA(Asn/Gln) amidotransferase C subunit
VISKEDIQKLAELSRIKLTDAEMESLQKDISGILDYVGQVSAIEGSAEKNVPLNHNVMRDDIPYEETSQLKDARDAIIAQFPKQEKEYNVVRKIIQKDE